MLFKGNNTQGTFDSSGNPIRLKITQDIVKEWRPSLDERTNSTYKPNKLLRFSDLSHGNYGWSEIMGREKLF